MRHIGSLTGFIIPDDLTDDLLKDALCIYGDVNNMDREELIKLWHEKTGCGLDGVFARTYSGLVLHDPREYRPDAKFID